MQILRPSLFALALLAAAAPADAQARRVDTAPVTRQHLKRELPLVGGTEAWQSSTLVFRVEGYLSEVNVERGMILDGTRVRELSKKVGLGPSPAAATAAIRMLLLFALAQVGNSAAAQEETGVVRIVVVRTRLGVSSSGIPLSWGLILEIVLYLFAGHCERLSVNGRGARRSSSSWRGNVRAPT